MGAAMQPDRRGEAHLWLLLEEVLVQVRGAEVEPWEAWRNFRAVVDALVVTGALAVDVGDALVGELDDALAVRAVVPAGAFAGAPWPSLDVLTAFRPAPPPRAAVVWLEAEVERHLDLFASFGSDAQAWAAADLVRIIGGPVAAFSAVGMLDEDAGRILDDVIATLAAVGIDVPQPAGDGGEARPPWVEFLRSRPAPLPVDHAPVHQRLTRLALGRLGGIAVRIDSVAWSEEAIEGELALRSRPGSETSVPLSAPWHVRIRDAEGRLHLGQPVTARRGAGSVRFSLRPGLATAVGPLEVRVTRGGERVEASVPL